MEGFIFNIQPFSLQDGPGIRTTVFTKGCNLRCYWCHNPESISAKPVLQFFANKCIGCSACAEVCPGRDERTGKSAVFTDRCIFCGKCADACYGEAVILTGYEISSQKLFETIKRDKSVYERSGGGVTFSGGEPLLQKDFLVDIMKKCKSDGINSAVETALHLPWDTVEEVALTADYFICDIKTMDSKKHRDATGAGNELILSNIERLSSLHNNLTIRTPIIPGFNNSDEDMEQTALFVSKLKGRPKVELMPFHGICEGKYASLNQKYKASGLPTPSKDEMAGLAKPFIAHGINVKY